MWEYKDVFLEQQPKGHPPKRDVEHAIKVELSSKPLNMSPYRLGPTEQDELERQDQGPPLVRDLSGPALHLMEHHFCSSLKRTVDGGCASIIKH